MCTCTCTHTYAYTYTSIRSHCGASGSPGYGSNSLILPFKARSPDHSQETCTPTEEECQTPPDRISSVNVSDRERRIEDLYFVQRDAELYKLELVKLGQVEWQNWLRKKEEAWLLEDELESQCEDEFGWMASEWEKAHQSLMQTKRDESNNQMRVAYRTWKDSEEARAWQGSRKRRLGEEQALQERRAWLHAEGLTLLE